MHIRRIRHALASVAMLMLFASSASGAGYSLSGFQFPDPLTAQTYAHGINGAGDVVGHYEVFNELNFIVTYGFRRDANGIFYRISVAAVPNELNTTIWGINDAGDMVGFYFLNGPHGFVRDPANHFTPVDITPAGNPVYGINSAGDLVGSFFDPLTGNYRGFLRVGTTVTAFDLEPGTPAYPKFTEAYGVNAGGQVVGQFTDQAISGSEAARLHGFLRDASGVLTTIDVPGASHTAAYGINGAGDIVGLYLDSTGGHGFVRDVAGTYTTVDVPGSLETVVHGIADDGRIAGWYLDINGLAQAFVGTPVLVIAQQTQQLIAQVDTLQLERGVQNSLDAKLRNAEAALEAASAGNSGAACNQLRAFLNEVRAQAGKKIAEPHATGLTAAATRIRTTLGCS